MSNQLIDAKVSFPKPKDMGYRDWGTETLLAIVPDQFSLKKLVLKAGFKGGLQYHHKKNECGYLISGELIIRFDDGNGNLVEKNISSGDSFHFPPGAVHQEEALTDCVIIEASTPISTIAFGLKSATVYLIMVAYPQRKLRKLRSFNNKYTYQITHNAQIKRALICWLTKQFY